METIGELVGKLIEHVCVVSHPSEQNQSLTCAAPIQDLKLNARLDRDQPDFMSRSIKPADLARYSTPTWRGSRGPTIAAKDPGDKATHNAQHQHNPNLPF